MKNLYPADTNGERPDPERVSVGGDVLHEYRDKYDPDQPLSGPRLGEAVEAAVEALPGAVTELGEMDLAPGTGTGDQILSVAGDIVLSHLQFLRTKQLEEGVIARADANFALKTLQTIERQKELLAWSGALSRVDSGELREALQRLKDMKAAEKIIHLDKGKAG